MSDRSICVSLIKVWQFGENKPKIYVQQKDETVRGLQNVMEGNRRGGCKNNLRTSEK